MRYKLFAVATLALLVVGVPLAKAQTAYNSTYVKVNIGVATQAMFGFGPTSSPVIGQTVVIVQCAYNRYFVYTNYATVNQQLSGAIPLTCSVTRSRDPDGDSNQYTSVVVTSAQSGQVGSQTVTLNSASFQSEQVGMHDQNETLGGSAQITMQ
jgi:hypothetical protein